MADQNVENLDLLAELDKEIDHTSTRLQAWLSESRHISQRTYYVSVSQVVSLHVMCIVYNIVKLKNP